jgi:hypothetical protein
MNGFKEKIGIVVHLKNNNENFGIMQIIGKTAIIHWGDGTVAECSTKILKKIER